MKINELSKFLEKLHFIKIGNVGKSNCPTAAPSDADIYRIPGFNSTEHIFVSKRGVIFYGNKTLDTSEYADIEIGWNLAEIILK